MCRTFFSLGLLCWHLNIMFRQSLKGKRDLVQLLLGSVKMKNYLPHIFVLIRNSSAQPDWWWDNLPGRHCTSLSKTKQETSVTLSGPRCLKGREGEKKQDYFPPGEGKKKKPCRIQKNHPIFMLGSVSTICKYFPRLQLFPSFFLIRKNVGRGFVLFRENWTASLQTEIPLPC